jgi:hypothetical protein
MAFQRLLDLQESLRKAQGIAALWFSNNYPDRITMVDEKGNPIQMRLDGKTFKNVKGKITYRRGKEDGGYPVSQTVFTDEAGDETIVDSKRI